MSMGREVTAPAAASTRAEQVHGALRAEILAGRLAPGTRLRLVELAERFSVSQSVIREALTRLAGQQIVIALPQQGFRVAPLTLADLTALTEARMHIEGLVLRLAVQRGDVAWEASAVAAHHQLLRTPTRLETGGVNEQWLTAHETYHAALLAGCGNDRLLQVAGGLRDAAALYRIWSFPLGQDEHRDLPGEHRGILEAVLARDAGQAADRLTRHIERTSSVLLAVAERTGEPQLGPTG
jgi:DNA-binding GntR family transcriptional regulator